MTILFLCREQDLLREPLGYVRAFRRRGIQTAFAADGCSVNDHIDRLLERLREKPALIIQPETDFPLCPRGLTETEIPTACFYHDPYAYLHRRIRWSMLFDYIFLFHPGFEDVFRQAGHSNPVTITHAVDANFFLSPSEERPLDIGWIGRSAGPTYETRRRILEMLATRFRMNEWTRLHSYEEMARIYCTSKLVVNVGRDDYPVDVSLRFAEAMAAGALFITMLPSEIGQLGFQDGVHFVGVRSEAEVLESVRYYLDHEAEWRKIADAGREKVMREHTYDDRAQDLLRTVESNNGKLFAPARDWPEERVRLARLDYFAANARLNCAYSELVEIAKADFRGAVSGGALLARAFAAKARSQFNSFWQRSG